MIYIDRQTEQEMMKKWDETAKPYEHYCERSSYFHEFISRSGIKPGDTVFDMGCGSGTLCVPLAEDGYTVFGADFSEKALDAVRDVIAERGIKGLTLKRLSFLDDWDDADIPDCDYVFASRCLNSLDPAVVLPKLTRYAKKRVCITIHVNHHDGILSGFKYRGSDSLEYEKACFNAVIDMGYYPRVDYMDCMFDEIKGGWTFISWDV